MERKRTKAAVGEVGGWAALDKMAAQVTSRARLERDYLQGVFFGWSALKMTKSQPLKEFSELVLPKKRPRIKKV